MTMAEKILALRKKEGLSQEELAEKLGVSRQAISRWEMGAAFPDAPNILGLSRLFGVTTDYLLYDEYETVQAPHKTACPIENAPLYMGAVFAGAIALSAAVLVFQFINAAYYQSEGQMASHSLYEEHSYHPYFNEEGSMDAYLTRSEREYKTYTDFSIEIYMSVETVLLKVDRLEYYSYSSYTYTNEIDSSQNEEEETWEEDETLDRLAEHLGEWIDCTASPEIARDFLTVNESNVETLGSIGDFLDRALLNESQFFTHEDGHYTASEEEIQKLYDCSIDVFHNLNSLG